ncbi:MAG: 4-hydroxybenzoate octaprenyltransferase [Fimbriimonadaceae bacterium]|nr:4-hydroxybenzoate octaprenyltransferase [Alphaproteobacteria bacterium]
MQHETLNSGTHKTQSVADAVEDNWVDRWAPKFTRPYLRLMRADRPIGTWLLLWPGLWSVALASDYAGYLYPSPWYLALFCIGAFVMRGAGCTFNDIVDRDFDNKVARTRSRPIPSGQVTVGQAIVFMIALCLIGALVLLAFNWFAVAVGVASLITVAVYPFMKRVTYWPQLFLGFAFNWGALLGWAAVLQTIAWPAIILYIAGICWTIGYDTIYAHQDKEDDILIGIKSTAIRFGAATKSWLSGFYGAAIFLMTLSGWLAGCGFMFYLAIAGGAAHMIWQITTLDSDDPDQCLLLFRSNRGFGWIIFAGILADTFLTASV